MFQKVSEWLTEKSDRMIRGGHSERPSSYYASDAADRAYNVRREDATDEDTEKQPLDPFGRDANDEYGGRVPYRSQRDAQLEAEQQREQQRQMEETVRRQAVQPVPPQPGFNAQPPQAAYPAQPAQTAYAANPAQAQQPNNVVPFPGMMQGQNGNVYAHVEYIVLLCNRSECTKVIEYIKTTASVFLNMEFIANDSERQRCVDMLSGAAYTLGCQLTKISARGIYLISSPAVQVVVDPKLRKYTSMPESQGFVRQNYDYSPYNGYAAQPNDGYGYAGNQQRTAHRATRQQPTAAMPQMQPMQQAQQQPVQQPQPVRQAAPRTTFSASSPTSSFAAQPQRAANGMQSMFGGSAAYGGYAEPQGDRYTAEYKA